MSDVATRTINILGLCSGLGWLEFAAAEAFRARGMDADVVCHCEREAVTAALLSRLQDATGHQAPIWDDIATFDGHPWRGIVDCVTAGLPCPAYSVAGKRTGNDDERAWGQDGDGPQFHFLRIVGEILPTFIFLENVPQFVSGGHFRRLGDGLLGLGYRIPPALYLSAGDVGATQERERVFILAYRENADRWSELQPREQGTNGRARLAGVSGELGDSYPPGRGYWTDPEWQRVIRLDTSRVPATEPGFSMVVDGVAVAASDLLRIGGNGVVPLVAAVALDVLLAEAGLLP